MVGGEIAKWLSSFWVWRVSSHAMRSTSLSTRSARKVMSSRLPMGVATRYSPGSSKRLFLALATQFSALCQQAHGVHQVLQCDNADDAFAFGHRHQGESSAGKAADRRTQRVFRLGHMKAARHHGLHIAIALTAQRGKNALTRDNAHQAVAAHNRKIILQTVNRFMQGIFERVGG